MKTVEFLLHKSLPDKIPTIVKRERPVLKVAHGLWTRSEYYTRGALSKLELERDSVEL